MSINSSDTSISKSTQLDYAIPASKIASLSSGEFVGIVADNPDCKIRLKVFHSEIRNDHQAIKVEEDAYKAIPVIAEVTLEDIEENYKKIKQDIEDLFDKELKNLNCNNGVGVPPTENQSQENQSLNSIANNGPTVSM